MLLQSSSAFLNCRVGWGGSKVIILEAVLTMNIHIEISWKLLEVMWSVSEVSQISRVAKIKFACKMSFWIELIFTSAQKLQINLPRLSIYQVLHHYFWLNSNSLSVHKGIDFIHKHDNWTLDTNNSDV